MKCFCEEGNEAIRTGGPGGGSSGLSGSGHEDEISGADSGIAFDDVAAPGNHEEGILAVVETPACRPGRSARVVELALRFGLGMAAPARRIAERLMLSAEAGTITLLRGPSGSGKTLLLEAMARRWPTSRLMHSCPFPLDVPVIDAVAPARGIEEAMGLLTACGLGEPALWLRRFDQISEGERFRARLARAFSLHHRGASQSHASACETSTEALHRSTPRSGRGEIAPLLCDEFGSTLHSRIARAIAFNLRKLVTRQKLAMVIATSRGDIEPDLQPDHVIEHTDHGFRVAHHVFPARPASDRVPSFAKDLRIEPGNLSDYAQFAPMHYRRRESIGFIDRIFVLRSADGDPLAAVVYGHASLELRARNNATGGRFSGNARLLNNELRVLKRLVVHPDARGCGLGHLLVRKTLPLAGVRFVECLAAMGLVNPVFEKAGMRRIGVCELPAGQERTLAKLRTLGADPLRPGFAAAVRERPEVRTLAARAVTDWYRGMTAGGEKRVEQQSAQTLATTYRQIVGSRPVYYLWQADGEGLTAEEKEVENGNA